MNHQPSPAEAVIAALREFLGERLSTGQSVREQHSRGEDMTPPTLPDAVAFAETTEEVSRIVALCHRHGVAVTPFGAGTSLEGHVNPVRAGISLDLSRMTAVLEVNAEHALVKKLAALPEGTTQFDDLAQVLFDNALLAEGGQLDDPAAHVKRIQTLILG